MDEAKVEADVGVTRLREEARMAFGVHARLVDPRVQGGVVNVLDLLTWGHTMIQFDSIGTTSTESVTWVEKVDEFKAIHERLEVRRGFFEAFPVTPPHFHDVVPSVFKIFDFLLGCVVHILHGPITVTYMFFVTVGITAGTPVDETTLEFVHRVRVLAVPIHEEVRIGDVIPVTGGGNGDMSKGIEPREGFKQAFEGQTTFFQETHVRFAVIHQFFQEIKHDVLVALLLMPPFKFLTCFGGHGFGHEIIDGRKDAHVRLVLREVELVGEVPLLEFR